MSSNHRWVLRVPVALCAASGLYICSAVQSASAWAHVHASSDDAVRGATAIVTFEVPNESGTGAATTALTVVLPNVASALAETTPGWTTKLDRDAASGVSRSVTWTAAPNSGIGVDQFGLFRISMQLPDADTVSFPATQTYSDGSVVKWDQPAQAGGGEPEHPAPTLTLTAESGAHGHHTPAAPGAESEPSKSLSDNIARLLGGAGLVVGALAVILALNRRRGQPTTGDEEPGKEPARRWL
jgi:uncharacterized protein YcnI